MSSNVIPLAGVNSLSFKPINTGASSIALQSLELTTATLESKVSESASLALRHMHSGQMVHLGADMEQKSFEVIPTTSSMVADSTTLDEFSEDLESPRSGSPFTDLSSIASNSTFSSPSSFLPFSSPSSAFSSPASVGACLQSISAELNGSSVADINGSPVVAGSENEQPHENNLDFPESLSSLSLHSTMGMQNAATDVALQKVKEKASSVDTDEEFLSLASNLSSALLLSTATSAPQSNKVAALPPFSAGKYPYCLAYLANVRKYYLFKDRSYFPNAARLSTEKVDQYKADLDRHFAEIEEPLQSSPAQRIFNKAIFDRIHQAIQESKVQYTERLEHSQGGSFILRPKPPITVATMIERIAPLFQHFSTNINPPLLYPLSAEQEYLHQCDRLKVASLLSLWDDKQSPPFADRRFTSEESAYFRKLDGFTNFPNISIAKMKEIIGVINEIERKGQSPSFNSFSSTIHSFEHIYNKLIAIRDEYKNILIDDEEDKEAFTLEVDHCRKAYQDDIVKDLESHLLDRLLEETVHALNAIEAKKAARATALRGKAANTEKPS